MLTELGDNSTNTDDLLSTTSFDDDLVNGLSAITQEDKVFVDALSATRRLSEIEDIRAVLEIFGIGS